MASNRERSEFRQLPIDASMLDQRLVNRHGITMARFPEWCEKYTALRDVPTSELEAKVQILNPVPNELRATYAYVLLLRYLLKRNGTLVKMYATGGERSITWKGLQHYHAIVVMDNTRIRMYCQYAEQRGYVRGWMVHYTYDSTYDIWAMDDVRA